MPRFRMYPLRNSNVLDIYQQKELIDLDPNYQRLSIWSPENRRLFIDSVINGVDIPKLYFHLLPRSLSQGRPYKYAVIDGKQRLMALWEFMDNEVPLPSDFTYFEDESIDAGGAIYAELLERFPRLRARFDGFDLPIILVEAEDDYLVEDLFSRLNVQMPLSAAERRNAMGGPLPLAIRRVARTPFFAEAVRVKNNRYQWLDLAVKFLYLTRNEGFQSTKKKPLDEFVVSYRKARSEGREMASAGSVSGLVDRTIDIVAPMREFFNQGDSLLGSTGRITLYFHMFRLHMAQGITPSFPRQVLDRFNADVTAARLKSQRRAGGAEEPLSTEEGVLLAFDSEKQSINDGGALKRQYDLARGYFADQYEVDLPESD